MPQFLALQCYKCSMMQVKQEKKSSNKWTCSLCNEKQSVRKVYASSGAAKDIRKFVQDCNFSHHSRKEHALADAVASYASPESENIEFGPGIAYGDSTLSVLRDSKVSNTNNVQAQKQSKWEEYLPTESHKVPHESSKDASENIDFVTSIPESRTRKRNSSVAEQVGGKFRMQAAAKSGGRDTSMYSYKMERQTRCGLDIQSPLSGPAEGIKSYHNLEFCAKKVPQKRVSGVHFDNSECISKKSFVRSDFSGSENVPPDTQRQSKTVAEASNMTISKWATFLEDVELQRDREKHESPISKWEEFGNPGEASSQVHLQQAVTRGKSETQMATSKWVEFLSFEEEPLSRIHQREETSHVWSLRAASTLPSLPGSIKTDLDELIDAGLPAESVEEEVHPLFT